MDSKGERRRDISSIPVLHQLTLIPEAAHRMKMSDDYKALFPCSVN